MIKNVIFDMDGTILNTLDDLADSVNYMLKTCGYPQVTVGEVRTYVGNGVRLLVKRALKRDVGRDEFESCFKTFSVHYDKNKENKTAPYDGILNLMKKLKSAGVKMAVVSNKYDEGVKQLTRKIFGEYIISAIGESESVKAKPAPDGVRLAMSELGANNYDTVYIGDSDVDYMTACNSGLPFIGVTWGFRDEELLRNLGALHIARRPDDVYDILTTERYGIVGHPLKHTMSPLLHSELFRISGRNAEYRIFDTDKLDNFRPIAEGLNVTIPYKISIIDRLNGIDMFASELGAVNCVDNKLIGYNTDFYGFSESFSRFYGKETGRIIVLGYGGAGKVVVKALEKYDVTIAARPSRDFQAIERESGRKVIDINTLDDYAGGFDIIVNTTPVGMYPNTEAMPVGEKFVKSVNYVYDLIYNPLATELMKTAFANGAKAKSGADMLVYQAVKAHEIWYGAKFSDEEIESVIKTVTEALQKK